MILFFAAPAMAINFDKYTKDTEIKTALNVLYNANAHEVFDNLDENTIHIAFYDLILLSPDYGRHFAVNTVDSLGNRFILINSKFKHASAEELACLIAHESFHKLNIATVDEEALATKKEAQYWDKLKISNKMYEHSELFKRLENLSKLNAETNMNNDYILEKICNNSFYRQQLAIAQ